MDIWQELIGWLKLIGGLLLVCLTILVCIYPAYIRLRFYEEGADFFKRDRENTE